MTIVLDLAPKKMSAEAKEQSIKLSIEDLVKMISSIKIGLPEDNLGYSVLLSIDGGKSKGSGFRLKYHGLNFLVTAKHVLFDEGEKIRGEELIVTCQSSQGQHLNPSIFNIDLTAAKIAHGGKDDVAVILIGKNHKLYSHDIPLAEDLNDVKRSTILEGMPYITQVETGNARILSVDIEATRTLGEIKIANDIYLMGYPTSLGLQRATYFDYSKPLLRKGIIAGVNFNENTFIVDCPAYYGNSGGPIVEHGEDNLFRVIGLVSKYIPFEVEWVNSREKIKNVEYFNSGYTVCVPRDAVSDLIEKHFPIEKTP